MSQQKKSRVRSFRSKSQASRLGNQSGKAFERKIAQRLRKIYDPPELLAELEAATPQTRNAILKRSNVQRGDQRGGARVPDLVTPSNWWLELQWNRPGTRRWDASDKLERAERDIEELGFRIPLQPSCCPYRPAVIWARKGSPIVSVTLRAGVLAHAIGFAHDAGWADLLRAAPVILAFEDFFRLLQIEHGVR